MVAWNPIYFISFSLKNREGKSFLDQRHSLQQVMSLWSDTHQENEESLQPQITADQAEAIAQSF